MRPLRYSINVTLDGCCDHRAIVPDEELHRHAVENLDRADALLFGRVTYQMMEEAFRPAWTGEMPDWMESFRRTIDAAKKYVVSSTLDRVDWSAELVRGDLGKAVPTERTACRFRRPSFDVQSETDHDHPRDEEWPMNIMLWILQALLAAAFAAHGWMLVSPPPELLPIMNEQLGVAFRLFLGVAEIAGAIGMLVPAMTRKMPWLTPVAAGCLAFVVASATVLHLFRGETSAAVTTAILFLLAAFVAYARWRVRPIAPKGRGGSAARALTSSPA